jgi:hypothetical protein
VDSYLTLSTLPLVSSILSQLKLQPIVIRPDGVKYFYWNRPIQIRLDQVDCPWGIDYRESQDRTAHTHELLALSGMEESFFQLLAQLDEFTITQLTEALPSVFIDRYSFLSKQYRPNNQVNLRYIRPHLGPKCRIVDANTMETLPPTTLTNRQFRKHKLSVTLCIQGGFIRDHSVGLGLTIRDIMVYPPDISYPSRQWFGI